MPKTNFSHKSKTITHAKRISNSYVCRCGAPVDPLESYQINEHLSRLDCPECGMNFGRFPTQIHLVVPADNFNEASTCAA